ncbi:MAG: hypothetical protein C0392_10185 [Syntrophus sp. (in: bacteria)]|nr:hypothetical protein [Syntrophus sp. (in: bacteria)]
MENTQNISPSIIAFMAVSLVISVWAIIDIFRSNFSKLNKILWLLVVLFAPLGMLIYFIIGKRFLPPREAPQSPVPERQDQEKEVPADPLREENRKMPLYGMLIIIAILSIITYINMVGILGREMTGMLLLGAMAIVGFILIYINLSRMRKR